MVDAYVARCMHRRINYNLYTFTAWEGQITQILLEKSLGMHGSVLPKSHPWLAGWYHTGLVDVNILLGKTVSDMEQFPIDLLKRLLKVLHRSLTHPPADLVTVHDD